MRGLHLPQAACLLPIRIITHTSTPSTQVTWSTLLQGQPGPHWTKRVKISPAEAGSAFPFPLQTPNQVSHATTLQAKSQDCAEGGSSVETPGIPPGPHASVSLPALQLLCASKAHGALRAMGTVCLYTSNQLL